MQNEHDVVRSEVGIEKAKDAEQHVVLNFEFGQHANFLGNCEGGKRRSNTEGEDKRTVECDADGDLAPRRRQKRSNTSIPRPYFTALYDAEKVVEGEEDETKTDLYAHENTASLEVSLEVMAASTALMCGMQVCVYTCTYTRTHIHSHTHTHTHT